MTSEGEYKRNRSTEIVLARLFPSPSFSLFYEKVVVVCAIEENKFCRGLSYKERKKLSVKIIGFPPKHERNSTVKARHILI